MNGRIQSVSEAHLYQAVNTPSRCAQAPKSQKCQGKRGKGEGVSGGRRRGDTGNRGRQSESGPSLFNISFLWREVDCPFFAFRWLE